MAGTLLFSRLLLYITWDKLYLVVIKESVQVNHKKKKIPENGLLVLSYFT